MYNELSYRSQYTDYQAYVQFALLVKDVERYLPALFYPYEGDGTVVAILPTEEFRVRLLSAYDDSATHPVDEKALLDEINDYAKKNPNSRAILVDVIRNEIIYDFTLRKYKTVLHYLPPSGTKAVIFVDNTGKVWRIYSGSGTHTALYIRYFSQRLLLPADYISPEGANFVAELFRATYGMDKLGTQYEGNRILEILSPTLITSTHSAQLTVRLQNVATKLRDQRARFLAKEMGVIDEIPFDNSPPKKSNGMYYLSDLIGKTLPKDDLEATFVIMDIPIAGVRWAMVENGILAMHLEDGANLEEDDLLEQLQLEEIKLIKDLR